MFLFRERNCRENLKYLLTMILVAITSRRYSATKTYVLENARGEERKEQNKGDREEDIEEESQSEGSSEESIEEEEES